MRRKRGRKGAKEQRNEGSTREELRKGWNRERKKKRRVREREREEEGVGRGRQRKEEGGRLHGFQWLFLFPDSVCRGY